MNQTECKCSIVFFQVSWMLAQCKWLKCLLNSMDLSWTFQFSAASFLVDDASFTFEFWNGLYPILIRYLMRNFDQYASETSFIDLRSLIQSTTTIEMAVHKSCALIRLKFPHQITKEITNCRKSNLLEKKAQLSISTHLFILQDWAPSRHFYI